MTTTNTEDVMADMSFHFFKDQAEAEDVQQGLISISIPAEIQCACIKDHGLGECLDLMSSCRSGVYVYVQKVFAPMIGIMRYRVSSRDKADAKYVIFDSLTKGEFPVVFPAHIDHSFIVDCVRSKYPGIGAVRGGRMNRLATRWNCYGKGISAKLKSDPKIDNTLINSVL
jgi:hypothetical protein